MIGWEAAVGEPHDEESNASTLIDARQFGFFQVYNDIFDRLPVGKARLRALAAYIILCQHAGRKSTCFPSYQKIGSLMCGNRRTAVRAIQDLLAAGLITREKRYSTWGETSNLYTIVDLHPMPIHPGTHFAAPGRPSVTGAGQIDTASVPPQWPNCHSPSGRTVTPPVAELSPRTILKEQDEENKHIAPKRKTSVDHWLPSEELKAWSVALGVVDLETTIAQFRDHWLGKGETRADWNASFRTWVRNEVKWASERPSRDGHAAKTGDRNDPGFWGMTQGEFDAKRRTGWLPSYEPPGGFRR